MTSSPGSISSGRHCYDMSRKGSAKALAVLSILGAVLTALTGAGTSLLATAFGGQHPENYKWYVLTGVLAIVLTDVVIKVLTRKGEAPSASQPIWPTVEASAQQNVIRLMKEQWIREYLEKSLYSIARLELRLKTRSNLHTRRSELFLGRGGVEQIPQNRGAADVWLKELGCILILGEAGSGKTTRMAELVRDFLSNMEEDSTAPIPIALNLATWAGKQESMQKWCLGQLKNQVSALILDGWIANARIILLLDALDQVPPENRGACISAINEFRASHPEIRVIISCRASEHQTVFSALQIDTILTIQPLTRESIDSAVAEDLHELAGLRKVLDLVPDLYDTLQTPLMLDVARIVYASSNKALTIVPGTPEHLRRQLFDAYVIRMIDAKDFSGRSKARQTVRALAYIASNLRHYGQTYFNPESLVAVSWYGGRDEFAMRILKWTSGIVGAISGLTLGAILGALGLRLGLLIGLRPEWFPAWCGAVIGGLGGAVCAAPLNCFYFVYSGWMAGGFSQADKVVRLKSDLPRWLFTFLDVPVWMLSTIGAFLFSITMLTLALPVLLVVAASMKFPPGPVVGALMGAIPGIWWTVTMVHRLAKMERQGKLPENVFDLIGLGWLTGALKRTRAVGAAQSATTPGRAPRSGRRWLPHLNRWVLIGILLVFGVLVGVPLVVLGMPAVVLAGLIVILIYRVQGIVVRVALWSSANLPLNHKKFLRFATARALLREEFGNYQFIHPLLRDFFAYLAAAPSNPTLKKEQTQERTA
jgi:hypothetical protein